MERIDRAIGNALPFTASPAGGVDFSGAEAAMGRGGKRRRFTAHGCLKRSAIVGRVAVAAMVLSLAAGCSSPYFRKVPEPAEQALPPRTLAQWPFDEYWAGIVFNGAKIGFSHFSLSPGPDSDGWFTVRSEAVFRIRFLLFDKQIRLRAEDRVREDLSLVDFCYDYDLDGNRKRLSGRRQGDFLQVCIEAGGMEQHLLIPHTGALYPSSVIGLFPVREGLAVGRTYRYPVFDGETETVSEALQQVDAYEESDLFSGRAFRVRTRLHGQEVTSWIDESGRPKLEMSMGGVLIAVLETATAAKAYLAEAVLNKEEVLLDFSRVPVDVPIDGARTRRRLEVIIKGLPERFGIPSDLRQRCSASDPRGPVRCRIDVDAVSPGSDMDAAPLYLAPTLAVPARHPKIAELARQIVGGAVSGQEQVRKLLSWIGENIEPAPVDAFSAMDVLKARKGECQGQTFLFAALSRSLQIPTKVVNGIVYASGEQGFLYHTWAECLIGGAWVAVDPTFGQLPADATHIKLVEGETPADLFPLVDTMGKLSVRVLEEE
jgi:hypothetical protein